MNRDFEPRGDSLLEPKIRLCVDSHAPRSYLYRNPIRMGLPWPVQSAPCQCSSSNGKGGAGGDLSALGLCRVDFEFRLSAAIRRRVAIRSGLWLSVQISTIRPVQIPSETDSHPNLNRQWTIHALFLKPLIGIHSSECSFKERE